MELKLELFRDAIESRLVNLARFGPWPLELKLRQFLHPTRGNGLRLQRSRSSFATAGKALELEKSWWTLATWS